MYPSSRAESRRRPPYLYPLDDRHDDYDSPPPTRRLGGAITDFRGIDPTLPLTPIYPVKSAQTGELDGQYVVWIKTTPETSPEWIPCLFDSRAEAAVWVDQYHSRTSAAV